MPAGGGLGGVRLSLGAAMLESDGAGTKPDASAHSALVTALPEKGSKMVLAKNYCL